MATTLQIRNVPDDLRRQLQERAARSGTTLSEYVVDLLARSVRRERTDDMIERLAKREPVDPNEGSAEAVRSEREAH